SDLTARRDQPGVGRLLGRERFDPPLPLSGLLVEIEVVGDPSGLNLAPRSPRPLANRCHHDHLHVRRLWPIPSGRDCVADISASQLTGDVTLPIPSATSSSGADAIVALVCGYPQRLWARKL